MISHLDEPTEEQLRKLELKEELISDISLEEKLSILMELLFDDEKIREIYQKRFYTLEQKIEETRTDKYKMPEDFKEAGFGFGIAEFEAVYRSSLDRRENLDEVVEKIKGAVNGKDYEADVFYR